MSEKPSYPCDTLFDMARIPAEAMPRFLAEFPNMLAHIAPIVADADALGTLAEIRLRGATWIDDDGGTCDMRLRVIADGKEVASLRAKAKMADVATGSAA